MNIRKLKKFYNGTVYCLETEDNYLIETTDTFLPFYTKDAIGRKQNSLISADCRSRAERWMIGVSVMSGCPIHCKFCATGNMKKWRNLSSGEIVDQILFIINENKLDPALSKEFKINYTRMGEPYLNIENIKYTIEQVSNCYPHTHHYISTIGIKGSDFSWIKDNITLQISLHSLNEKRRKQLIPYNNLMSLEELGKIRTKSNLKTTLNLTLVDEEDFDINILNKYFDKDYFFIKLSPINKNNISEMNNLGDGVIK